MLRRCLPALVVMAFAGSAALRADDVYVRGSDKPIKGKIKLEDAKEIKVGLKDTIPADKVLDVIYDLSTASAFGPYKKAQAAEKESLDPAKEANRKAHLAEAVTKYAELLPMMTAADKLAKRHFEYKIAMLKVRQVVEDGAPAKDALAKLKDFAKNHPTAWQITNVYETLGRMQMDADDYAGAEETYTKMANLVTLPEETRMDARMLAVQAKLRAKKYDEARSDITELQRNLDKSSRYYARTKVAEAECLVAETGKFGKDDAKRAKLFDQAVEQVRGVIKESNDTYVKAVGHNTLGYCYAEQGKAKDAIWEFLWVDVVYNQDRIQHAKALYHLWDLFTKEGDAPRAQECREALLAPQFAGLDYQKRVQK